MVKREKAGGILVKTIPVDKELADVIRNIAKSRGLGFSEDLDCPGRTLGRNLLIRDKRGLRVWSSPFLLVDMTWSFYTERRRTADIALKEFLLKNRPELYL